MDTSQSESELRQILNLGEGQNRTDIYSADSTGDPEFYVDLDGRTFTRAAVEAAIAAFDDDTFARVAQCQDAVSSYSWPPERGHHSSGGQVPFGSQIVRSSAPRRYLEVMRGFEKRG